MKKVALIAICLVAVIDVAAGQELMTIEDLRQLRAENNMLRAQIRALKRRLAEATGKATTKPASRPGPRSRPSVKPTVKPAVKPTVKPKPGSTVFTIILYDENPKWWADIQAFAKEVSMRQIVGQLEPKHAVDAWLDRNKWFVGRNVKWKVKVSRRRALTKTMAGEMYFNKLNSKEAAEKTLASFKSGKRGAKAEPEAIRVVMANTRRQIRQLEAEAAQYKLLMDGDGGALVTGNIVEPASIMVTAAVPGGDEKMVAGKETEISGTIVNAVASATSVSTYSGSSGFRGLRRVDSAVGPSSLQVTLVGQ